jgi:hypothetical protein
MKAPARRFMEPDPVTPQAGPTLDGEGRISYVGEDGRRYVVDLPPEADEASVERVMAMLRNGSEVFRRIEELCHRWIGSVSGEELQPHAALVLLLTTLETALEEHYPDPGSRNGGG